MWVDGLGHSGQKLYLSCIFECHGILTWPSGASLWVGQPHCGQTRGWTTVCTMEIRWSEYLDLPRLWSGSGSWKLMAVTTSVGLDPLITSPPPCPRGQKKMRKDGAPWWARSQANLSKETNFSGDRYWSKKKKNNFQKYIIYSAGAKLSTKGNFSKLLRFGQKQNKRDKNWTSEKNMEISPRTRQLGCLRAPFPPPLAIDSRWAAATRSTVVGAFTLIIHPSPKDMFKISRGRDKIGAGGKSSFVGWLFVSWWNEASKLHQHLWPLHPPKQKLAPTKTVVLFKYNHRTCFSVNGWGFIFWWILWDRWLWFVRTKHRVCEIIIFIVISHKMLPKCKIKISFRSTKRS